VPPHLLLRLVQALLQLPLLLRPPQLRLLLQLLLLLPRLLQLQLLLQLLPVFFPAGWPASVRLSILPAVVAGHPLDTGVVGGATELPILADILLPLAWHRFLTQSVFL